MKKFCTLAITIFILHGCANNSKGDQIPPITKEKNTQDSFFPVTSFIKGQIFTLDSLPVTPLQVTIIKGKADSTWLSLMKLKPLLIPFLTPVITETNFTKYFKEAKFNDQTINAVTFTYDPTKSLPDSITLRHWDVYVDPETGKVIKVFIVKHIKDKDQIFTQQLTWQTDQQAKITTILNKPGGILELIKEEVFIWHF